MALSITRHDGGTGPVQLNNSVTLDAPTITGQITDYQWKRNGTPISGSTNASYTFTATDATVGRYALTFNVNGVAQTSDDLDITLAAQTGSQDPKAEFHGVFAVFMFIVVMAFAAFALYQASLHLLAITKADWTGANGQLAFAASLTLPALLLGGASLGLGLWMAVVEWRGRFAPKAPKPQPGVTKKGAAEDVGPIIEALGKLQGAALVLVIGAVLLLGSVWVASSATTAPSPSPTPAPTK